MTKELRRGKLTYPGKLDVPTAWAYLPDMARSFVEVAGRRHALPAFETLHFAGYQLTGRDWADALGDIAAERGWLRAGRKAGTGLQVKSLSWFVMRAVGWFVPTVAALCEMQYLWRTPHALINSRMAALAGPEPHTPFVQALRAALDAGDMDEPDALTGSDPLVVRPVLR